MLYRNILKHEAGFDYEFDEGILVNIMHMSVGNDGELDFEIDGEIACATVEEFKASWAPVIDNDSVKNLQKEWAKRIEEDKKILNESTYDIALSVNDHIYKIFEGYYRTRFKYDTHATIEYLKDYIEDERLLSQYIASILEDFLALWIAQHM